jgi:hypothetical protein
MRLVLFDENVLDGIRRPLTRHIVATAPVLGFAGLTNGDLIEAAEKVGFEVMITADQNLVYQQNLTGRRFAIIVLTTNHCDIIRPDPRPVGARPPRRNDQRASGALSRRPRFRAQSRRSAP